MARKERDHHAEGLRRKELAEARGYRNRYEQRRKIETGAIAPLQPKRVSSPSTLRNQEKRLAAKNQAKADREYLKAIEAANISPEQRARDWSMLFARSDVATYKPEDAKRLGLTKTQYTTAYLNAFVVGPDRYTRVRRNKAGASSHLHYWFVDLYEYMTIDEYESRYGPSS